MMDYMQLQGAWKEETLQTTGKESTQRENRQDRMKQITHVMKPVQTRPKIPGG